MILAPPITAYFSFFGFEIHYYSLCIFFGVVVSLVFVLIIQKKYYPFLDKDVILDFAPSLVIFSIIGARLYYVLLSLDYYIKNPLFIPMVWKGGLAIHGAIITGIIFGIYYFKKKNLPFFSYADIFALVLPVGQAIGRFGNFFNSEAFGIPVKSSLISLYIKEPLRPVQYIDVEYFHPVFLYESVLDFLIFILLFFLMKKTAKNYDGLIFFAYILLYSLVRSVLEFFRLDTVLFVFNIPFPVIISVIGILTGILGIIFRIKAKNTIS